MKLKRILSVLLSLCLLWASLAAMSEALETTGEAELWVSSDAEIEAAPEDADPEAPLWALEEETSDPSPVQEEEALFINAEADAAQENAVPVGEIPIDEAHFPNINFLRYVRGSYDTDGNGSLSQAEIAAVKSFNWASPHRSFSSIKGIEYFTAIEKLYYTCYTYSEQSVELDLSKLRALKELTLDEVTLDRLDLSQNTALQKLQLHGVFLGKLDLSQNTALTTLSTEWCEFDGLELGQCAALTDLSIHVTIVPELDLSGAKSLKTLNILGNAIDRLNLSGLTQFTELELSSNQLKELVLGNNPNLKRLFCINNQLKTLDIKGCGQLCALVNSTLPISDFSKYYPDNSYPALLYIDERTDCQLMVDKDLVVLYGFVPVSSIQLSRTKLDLKVGKKEALEAKVLPVNASNPTLDWSSSDESVATVNSNGRITAKGPGKATITAKAKDGSGVKATCKVTVPSSITLDKTKATVKAGKSKELKATVKVAKGKSKGVKWSSSNENVAKVSNGKVTAKKPGKATITAALKDGSGLKAKCKITVPTIVKLNKTKATVKLDKKLPLEATCKDAKGKDPGVRWSSSDDDVATVNSKGVVTAKGYGEATITAKAKDSSGGKATCKITVPASTKVKLTRSKMKLAKDKTVSLTATVTTDSGKSCAIKWSSSKSSIVSVSTKGVITAKKAGKATITATAKDGSGASDSCVVEVYAPGRTSVALNINNIRVKAKRNIWLGSEVKTTDGSYPEIAWSSSDSKVAKISSINGYTCVVSTKKPGTAIITAKAKDGSGAVDTCEIVVVEESAATITLTDDHLTLLPGDSQWLYAEVDDGTGNPPDVTWKSSNENVASVIDGQIWAKSPGTTNIIASVKGIRGLSATCRVVVSPILVSSIELSHSELELRKDDQLYLKATVGPSNATNKGLVWSSSDPSIATVDGSGKITAKQKKGKTTITATAADGGGAYATCEVEVVIPAYRALLIGEGNFPGAEINRNKNDVDNMYSMLTSVQGPTGESYSAYPCYDRSEGQILELIDEVFADADEHDVSLFFIASHGDTKASTSMAGALETVTPEGVKGTLPLTVLANKLKQVPGSVVVILESCGSGAAVYGNSADSRTVRQSLEAFNRAAVHAFSSVDDGIVVSDLSANTGEFRVANKFYVLTASAFQEESYGYMDQYNWFTKWLIDGVGTRGNRPADSKYAGNNNGIVDLHELYSYISAVGDNTQAAFFQYQHVQVYPSGSHFGLFK